MNIAVCDDNQIFIEDTVAKLKKMFPNENRYLTFLSGDELLSSKEDIDCLFLDIDMPGSDGIAVKEMLERKHSDIRIVFVTSYTDRMREAFGANVLGFLDKPVKPEALRKIVRKIMTVEDGGYIECFGDYEKMLIPVRDLQYIEAMRKNTCLHMADGSEIVLRKSIQKWEEELPANRFCRISRSYLIRYEYIEAGFNEAVMPNGTRVLISRMEKDQIKKQYIKYLEWVAENK